MEHIRATDLPVESVCLFDGFFHASGLRGSDGRQSGGTQRGERVARQEGERGRVRQEGEREEK